MNPHTITTSDTPANALPVELHVDGRVHRCFIERDRADAASGSPGFVERAFRHRGAEDNGSGVQ